jgi:ribonucleoside-triphosphate reductase
MIFSPEPPTTDRKPRTFQLSQSFLDDFKGKQPNWGPVGYFTYKRTYARKTCNCTSSCDHPTEEFWQTLQRVVEGCYNIQKLHCRQNHKEWIEAKAQKSAQEMFQRMWDFKFTPPGRGLWMMGTDLIFEKGSAALQNCAFVSTIDLATDFSAPFCFLMDMSMLGVGVGGDTRGAGSVKIAMPKQTSEMFTVEDSREGWVDVTRTVLNSFVGKGSFPTVIDFSKVRKRGEPIKGFGGIASGAAPLKKLLEGVTKLLMPKGVTITAAPSDDTADSVRFMFEGNGKPYRIKSSQIVDVFNYIGKCVVAGGVRRTAEIMFGEHDDDEFINLKSNADLTPLYAKKGDLEATIADYEKKGLPTSTLVAELEAVSKQIEEHPLIDRRWASNNSIFGHIGMDYTKVAEAVAAGGEPGIFWIDNARAYSRMGDAPDWKDDRVMGTNPCGEQSLESFELCNLVETYPAHHDSLEDFRATLKMAYLYAKTVTLVPTHDHRANQVMQYNRRIGASMSGIVQARQKLGHREFLKWCDEGYKYIGELDNEYSRWLGIPNSKKMTSIKPSGTVSLLCGATPGIHFPHSEHYIRRIRVANTSPLVQVAKDAGYHVEPDIYADDTSVVAFPVKEKYFTKGKNDATMWEQFALAAAVQRHWADNQVSVTVTFKGEEAKDIAVALSTYEDQLKSISMLPASDHGFAQAPYEEIDEATFNQMAARITLLDFGSADAHDVDAEEKFCSNDSCTIDFGPKS